MKTLKEILPPDLADGRTPAEEKLLEMAPTGKPTDCREGDEEKDDPADTDKWGTKRTVRADLLRWLLLDEVAAKLPVQTIRPI